MFPDEAQIFVQVLRRQKAPRRNVVELAGERGGGAPKDGMNDGELPRDDRQILLGVGGVKQECAAGQI